MRLLSWNVNGIRAIAKKGFLEWLRKNSPDILCLQETKSHPDQLDNSLISPPGYQTYWSAAEKKGYSGVSVFTKTVPQSFKEGLGITEFDKEGRVLWMEYQQFILFNIYFPNGGAANKRVPFKLAFCDAFLKVIDKLREKNKNIIMCGDVNTAHTEIDLARPKENKDKTGFLPEERKWITQFINKGYIDTFRHFTKTPGHYTWWDYKTKARERDIGWRIDYFFISNNLRPYLKSAFILKDIPGSDHCPVGIDLDLSL